MAVDDFVDSEIAIAVAATATLFSPPVRRLLRRGLVGGLAGILAASDRIRPFVQVVELGIERAGARSARGLEDIVERTQEQEAE